MKSIPENIELSKENPLNISVFESNKLVFPFHYHADYYELTLTIGSTGIRLVGDHMEEFEDVDLVMTGPGIPHCWLNNLSENDYPRENIMVVVIHFTEGLFPEELLKRKELAAIRQLFDYSVRGICYRGEIREKVKEDILRLKIETDFGTFVDIYSVLNKLSLSDEYFLLSSADYEFRGKDDELQKFERVHDHIARHFRNKIKIGSVADLVDMNESAFSHYFKKRTSKSFTEFINELRLNYAADQLTRTDKNIAGIASEAGFNNLSNFNRIFKKWQHITPNQWRKRTQPILA